MMRGETRRTKKGFGVYKEARHMADRDANRRLLRKKIAERRNHRTGATPPPATRKDPMTALLSMGVDNADVLRTAEQLSKLDATTIRRSLLQATETCSDDEQEAPPPPP